MNGPNACQFCGRYVLQVPGWTTFVKSYRMLLAPWDPQEVFLEGSFHHSCLRTSPYRREFRADALRQLTQGDHDVEVEFEGRTRQQRRPGMAFTEQVFFGASGELFRHANVDSWVFVEKDGPWHFLSADDVRTLAAGSPLRKSSEAGTTRLPSDPGESVAEWTLPELLDFLEVRDLYQEVLDRLEPEYTFWEFNAIAPKYFLDYSVDCVQPLPAELAAFCATYTYRARSLDWEDGDA
ncbi:hypothetical protein ACIOC1_06035 [Streptomyces sp. NPDC088197]|uniref:hypothetical protein n=1 Tax=unclassified Streptomyces TaxID=2593676 RepID=UPI0036E7BB13